MSGSRDYYEILHVHPDAPTEIIRSSYRTLMQRLKQHPDLGGDHENAALINEAYATLTDPDRRAEYDRGRGPSSDEAAPAAKEEPPPAAEKDTKVSWHAYRGMGLGYCGFCKAAHDHGAEAPEDTLCDNCASPLHRTQRHSAVQSEGLRALERIPKQQAICFYTDWPGETNAGHTRDISLDGMQFETACALTVNQMIKIDCDACRAVARVAHVQQHAGTWIVGVEFVTLRFEKVQGTFVSAQV